MEELVEIRDLETESIPPNSYSPLKAWYAFCVFEIQLLAVGIDIAIVTLLVHPMETAFRINDIGFAAITATPYAIGVAVGAYPAGLLTDMFRRRDIIAVGSLIWAVAAIVAARAGSPGLVFFARFLVGVGTVVPGPPIFSILTDAFPRARRAFVMSFYSATASIGGGIGLTFCGSLVEATRRLGVITFHGIQLVPWQQCFVAVAGIGFFICFLSLTVPEPPRFERASDAERPSFAASLQFFVKFLGRHGLLWGLLLLGSTISVTSLIAVNAWGPAFGQRHFGITGVTSIALLGAFSAVGCLLGSIGGGYLAKICIHHRDPRILTRILAIISCATLIIAVIFPFMPSWTLVAAGIGAINATVTAAGVLIQIGMQETAPNEARGQLNGLWGIAAGLPLIIGPTSVAFFASGIFAKRGDLGPAMALVGAITCTIAIPLFALCSELYARARHELRPELRQQDDVPIAIFQRH